MAHTALGNYRWLQVIMMNEEQARAAFEHRFGYAPDQVVEGHIGNVKCWYIGPLRDGEIEPPSVVQELSEPEYVEGSELAEQLTFFETQ